MHRKAVEKYAALLDGMDANGKLSRCLTAEIRPPMRTKVAPPANDYFPPALIPIWSQQSEASFYGVWRAWFPIREISFVDLSVEDGDFTEIGKTVEQFLIVMALQSLIAGFGRVTDRCLQFCEALQIDVKELEKVADRTGDSLEGLADHPAFVGNLPAGVVNAQRSGADPMAKLSGFEIEASAPNAPEWVRNPEVAFRKSYPHDPGVAWLALNSPDWNPKEWTACVSKMKGIAAPDEFKLQIEAWLATGMR
jgi:hypothetical protein